jgi:anti-sigma factor RsiW
MNVTRDVVSDLWPLYASGDASADTRALVEAFLARDPEFARLVQTDVNLPTVEAPMRPDIETAALRRTRDLVRGSSWLRGVRLLAVAFSIFAIRRILSDTTWTASPRVFIADAVLASICWTIHIVWLRHERKKALRV